VQPYGRKPHEHTTVGEYRSVAKAFDALDALAEQMERTGVAGDAIEAYVVDSGNIRVQRPRAH